MRTYQAKEFLDAIETNSLPGKSEKINICDGCNLNIPITSFPENPLIFETTLNVVTPLSTHPHKLETFNGEVRINAHFCNSNLATFGPNARFGKKLKLVECPIATIPEHALPGVTLMISCCKNFKQFNPKCKLPCVTYITHCPLTEVNIDEAEEEVHFKKCYELKEITGSFESYLFIEDCPRTRINCTVNDHLTINVDDDSQLPKFGPKAQLNGHITILDKNGKSHLKALIPIFDQITHENQIEVLQELDRNQNIKGILQILPTIEKIEEAIKLFKLSPQSCKKASELLQKKALLTQMLNQELTPEN
jgi:hypothetical protein